MDFTNPDIYVVNCKPDGSYYRKQCYAQRHSCWCVDPGTGKEIDGTWRGPKDGPTQCDGKLFCCCLFHQLLALLYQGIQPLVSFS